jgi:hypothetical protein
VFAVSCLCLLFVVYNLCLMLFFVFFVFNLCFVCFQEKLRESSVVLSVWKKSAGDKREVNELKVRK